MRRSSQKIFLATVGVILSVACSKASDRNPSSPKSTWNFSARDVFDHCRSYLTDTSDLEQLKKLSLSDYIDIAANATSKIQEDLVVIDGKKVDRLSSRLKQLRSSFLDVQNAYPSIKTIGDLWRSTNFDPSLVDFQNFSTGLGQSLHDLSRLSTSRPAKLALTSKYVPVYTDECKSQHALISKWYNGVSLKSVACAVAMQKDAGKESISHTVNLKPRVGSILTGVLGSLCIGSPMAFNPALTQPANVGQGWIWNKPAIIAGEGGIADDYFDRCFQPMDSAADAIDESDRRPLLPTTTIESA